MVSFVFSNVSGVVNRDRTPLTAVLRPAIILQIELTDLFYGSSSVGVRLLLNLLHKTLRSLQVDRCLFVPIGYVDDEDQEHDMMMIVWRTGEDEYELTVSVWCVCMIVCKRESEAQRERERDECGIACASMHVYVCEDLYEVRVRVL
jgi:hypothetical protein